MHPDDAVGNLTADLKDVVLNWTGTEDPVLTIALDGENAWQSYAYDLDDDGYMEYTGDMFREQLYTHTGGHPLFTVELLRDFQERGFLTKDPNGAWVIDQEMDWKMLPARVEGVVAERLQGLESEILESLSIASVEGEQFTAEVIAEVQSLETRPLVRQLSGDLQKVHHVVEGLEVMRIGDQRLSDQS